MVYARYGGLGQMNPLTEEEKLYDESMRKCDELEREILNMPLTVFKAGEFSWFEHDRKKFRFATQPLLDRTIEEYRGLLKSCKERLAECSTAWMVK